MHKGWWVGENSEAALSTPAARTLSLPEGADRSSVCSDLELALRESPCAYGASVQGTPVATAPPGPGESGTEPSVPRAHTRASQAASLANHAMRASS
eukprot:COSAG05_NODE_221_length_13654_cov_29.450103_4_plen_97_part_00